MERERERKREGEREGEKHQYVVASYMPPTGDLVCNPGMCPDWELNQQPFSSQAVAQSTEPHQPGRILGFLIQNLFLFLGQEGLGSGELDRAQLGPNPSCFSGLSAPSLCPSAASLSIRHPPGDLERKRVGSLPGFEISQDPPRLCCIISDMVVSIGHIHQVRPRQVLR